MARVVYEPAPNVQPARPAGVFQRITPPNLSIVGAAAERAGGQIEAGAAQLGQAALEIQGLHNQVAGDEAANQYESEKNKLLYGDGTEQNPGLFSMRGADALRASQGAMSQLDEVANRVRGGLQNDRQRLEFDLYSRRSRLIADSEVGRFSEQARREWATDTNNATLANATQAIGASYNNPDVFNTQLERLRHTRMKQLQLRGEAGDPAAQQQALSTATSDAVRAGVMGAMARGDYGAAGQLLDRWRDQMDPHTAAELDTHVRPHANAAEGSAIAGRLWSGGRVFGAPGEVGESIARSANIHGVDPSLALGTAAIESDYGRNLGRRGNIFQLGPHEWQTAGGGDMADPNQQINNGIRWLGTVKTALGSALGRDPTNAEIYLAHQQGTAGATALLNAPPGTPAGRVVPPENIRANGGDPSMPADQFVQMWRERYNRAALGAAPLAREGQARSPTAEAAAISPPDRIGHLLQQVDDAETAGLDPEIAEHARTALKRRYSEWETITAQDRQAMRKSIEDGLARLSDGKPYDYDSARAHALFPADQAAILDTAVGDARTAGELIGAMRTETPAQIAANRAHLAAGLDDPNAPDYARRKRLLSAYDTIASRHLKELASDPAGYIGAWNEQLTGQLHAALNESDPQQARSDFDRYATAMLGMQERLGVDPQGRHVLSAQAARQLSQQLVDDPQDAPTRMRGMAERFGAHWADAWHDLATIGKLPPTWQLVGQLADYDPQNSALLARQLAQESGKAPPDRAIAGKTGQGGQSIAGQIDQTVFGDPHVMDFDRSLATGFVSATARNGIIGGIISLATARATFLGEDAVTAASNAVQAVVGHYEFTTQGTARAPASIFDAVSAHAAETLQSLSPANVTIPPGFGGGAEPTPQDYVAHIQAAPTWINSPKGDAWWLLDPGRRFVLDRAGHKVAVPLSGSAVVNAPSQAAPGFEMPPPPPGM